MRILGLDFICEWRRHFPSSLNPKVLLGILKSIYREHYWFQFFSGILQSDEGFRPDIVYCYWSLTEAPGIVLACRKFGIPVVQRAHGFDLYGERNPIGFIPFQSRNIERATATFAVSERGKEHLRSVAPGAFQRIKTARLGVPVQQSSSPERTSTFRIVSCSSLKEVKRVDLIARAVIELQDESPNLDFEWVHFGSGPLMTKVRCIVESGIKRPFRVVFRGQVEHEEIINYYKTNHVSLFMNVSSSEGVPVSIMEAMSFGIPVIATDVGGTSEIVTAQSGLLVPNNAKPEDLAGKIQEVINWAPSTRRNYIKSAVEMQREKCSAARNYSAFAKEMLTLIK
jgi:glycosyltransferase involved in cell wall biosynthesis